MQNQFLLFAQAFPKGQGPGPPPELFTGTVIAIMIGVFAVMLLISLAIGVFYCLTLSKALNRVSERNRLVQPGLVWLLLIPCVGFVWHFFIAIWVPDSLKKEFQDRDMDDGTDYGKLMGLLASGSSIAANVVGVVPFVGGVCGGVIGLAGLVLFIIFWVKIAGYSAKLAEGGSKRGRKKRGSGDDDDDDDRPRKRRARDDEDEDEDDRPRRKKRRDDDDD